MDLSDVYLKRFKILYSTRSGRSKACARRVARIVWQETSIPLCVPHPTGTTFDDAISDLHSFARELTESNTCLLLFVSTTGDGEHTDTIQRTWKQLLQRSLPNTMFKGVFFAIYNLGDRAYGPQFCAAGRKLAVRLLQLGARLLCEPGYGDDATPNGGVFADLDGWIGNILLPTLQSLGKERTEKLLLLEGVGAPYHITVDEQTHTSSVANAEWRSEDLTQSYQEFFSSTCPPSAYKYNYVNGQRIVGESGADAKPLIGRIVTNARITVDDWNQNTRHIRIEATCHGEHHEMDVNNEIDLPYLAGDVVAILPANSDAEVSRFLRVLPSEIQDVSDRLIAIENKVSKSIAQGVCYRSWPSRCTLRGWLKFCADIHGLPDREDLRALSQYCSLEHPLGFNQQQKLVSLSETKDSALYADYVLREKRSWADVLYDFDSLRAPGSTLTIEALIALVGPLRPREFSIASSPSCERISSNSGSVHGFAFEICVAVVEGTTPLKRRYHGLCSNYLACLDPQSCNEDELYVRFWIRPGSFAGLPIEVEFDSIRPRMKTPVLFVGSGTGIAPLRGLIWEREARLKSCSTETDQSHSERMADLQPENILVFGCRKEAADFYYRDEWKVLQQEGNLIVHVAFSREQWHKIYVQQVLEREEKAKQMITKHILENGGALYIAGGPSMAKTVQQVVVEALAKRLGGDKEAKQVLLALQRLGKFSVEAWS